MFVVFRVAHSNERQSARTNCFYTFFSKLYSFYNEFRYWQILRPIDILFRALHLVFYYKITTISIDRLPNFPNIVRKVRIWIRLSTSTNYSTIVRFQLTNVLGTNSLKIRRRPSMKLLKIFGWWQTFSFHTMTATEAAHNWFRVIAASTERTNNENFPTTYGVTDFSRRPTRFYFHFP